ncbi:MAG: hypothetical protein IJY38_04750 [Clostridia bacterium]|nr:hypothetical protein [Clostridia bacterium]
MEVKDILLKAAAQMGILDRVKGAYDNGTANQDEEVQALLKCFHLVENEVALDYIPLRAEDTLISPSGTVRFSELALKPVRIISVTDEWGNSLKFKLFHDFLKTEAGKIKILYSYLPMEKDAFGESDFQLLLSERALSFGVCAEYCLLSGLYEQANVWQNKYKDAIKAAMRSQKSRVISSRRWA